MPQNWNLELAKTLKEICFGATPLVFVLFISVVLAYKYKVKKTIKFFIVLSFFGLLFFCCRATPNILLNILLNPQEKMLDKKYFSTRELISVSECVHNARAVVVLGGGVDELGIPSHASFTRIKSLVSLLNSPGFSQQWAKNNSPILFSGGHTDPTLLLSEAEVFKHYAAFFYGNKFTQFNTITENQSKNTYQNAFYSKQMLQHAPSFKKVILLTNTFHMRRASLTFRAQGFQVCAVPVASSFLYGSGVFNFDNAIKTGTIVNEYAGMVGYFIKGWI